MTNDAMTIQEFENKESKKEDNDMTKMSSSSDFLQFDEEGQLKIDDAAGMQDRFLQGFSGFLESKKRAKVLEVLTEEFPHLANNAAFINNIIAKLGDDSIDEKQFVFLVMNQKVKQ